MRKSKYTEHQIIVILKEADAGIKVQELSSIWNKCCHHSINGNQNFSGMEASDLKKLRDVEAEFAQYKRMYAELAHENYALTNNFLHFECFGIVLTLT